MGYFYLYLGTTPNTLGHGVLAGRLHLRIKAQVAFLTRLSGTGEIRMSGIFVCDSVVLFMRICNTPQDR